MSKNLETAAFNLIATAKRGHVGADEFDCILMFPRIMDRERYKAQLMAELDHALITPEQRMVLWDKNHITIAGITFKLRHMELNERFGDASPEAKVNIARATADRANATPVELRLAIRDLLSLIPGGAA